MTRHSLWMCILCLDISCAAQVHNDQIATPRASDGALSDADFCRNGSFPREQEDLRLGVVQGQAGEKVHLFDDLNGCPSDDKRCMRRAYLIPGNEILVGKTKAGWACVWYQGRDQEFVAWVPKKNVALHPAPPLSASSDWVGLWASGPDNIRISPFKASGQLQILSELRWDGGISPDGEPLAHFGGMKGMLSLQDATASAVDGSCEVRLTRIGKYLVADDNGACGALNVRHTGVYVRQRQQHRP